MLSEFGAFQQNPEEKLIQAFDRFNHMLGKMIKHGVGREVNEQKVTYLNGLRPEWMAVASNVKAHEQFKSYSLAKMVGILKSHESVVTKKKKWCLLWDPWPFSLRQRMWQKMKTNHRCQNVI